MLDDGSASVDDNKCGASLFEKPSSDAVPVSLAPSDVSASGEDADSPETPKYAIVNTLEDEDVTDQLIFKQDVSFIIFVLNQILADWSFFNSFSSIGASRRRCSN